MASGPASWLDPRPVNFAVRCHDRTSAPRTKEECRPDCQQRHDADRGCRPPQTLDLIPLVRDIADRGHESGPPSRLSYAGRGELECPESDRENRYRRAEEVDCVVSVDPVGNVPVMKTKISVL